ncbi:hypothetical protein E2562_000010 [Oryza meyeriana var. granulata]|uniref:Uncharacterized protein n=1 Tax=Oryza meyeriana var. granulata TaxID=110450 RepID=A0A6G1DBW8_9ORYZ|nr:hypothetical protein E2562_000010 [Oryza meyeriana var. granulata]
MAGLIQTQVAKQLLCMARITPPLRLPRRRRLKLERYGGHSPTPKAASLAPSAAAKPSTPK